MVTYAEVVDAVDGGMIVDTIYLDLAFYYFGKTGMLGVCGKLLV